MPINSFADVETTQAITALSEKLVAGGRFLGTAESCTGGLIAAFCTDHPGSSAWFKGGIVSYSNEVKENILGVSRSMLDSIGAVSEPVVQTMLRGALEKLNVQAVIAVSGIAGPDGGTAEKPVGTVWISAGIMQDGDLMMASRREIFPGDRMDIRKAAAKSALILMADVLEAFDS